MNLLININEINYNYKCNCYCAILFDLHEMFVSIIKATSVIHNNNFQLHYNTSILHSLQFHLNTTDTDNVQFLIELI